MVHSVLLGLAQQDGRDLTSRQLATLLTIYLQGIKVHNITSIAKELHVSRPAVTKIADRLESHNFVKRETGRQDRRQVLLLQTVEGRAFIKKLEDLVQFGL